MSYSLIYCVTPGESAVSVRELRNGHGSAPAVWGAIGEKVLGIGRYAVRQDNLEKVCAVYYDDTQPMFLRAVLGMTFDYVYIERAHFRQAALDIRAFLSWAETPEGHANHWPVIAETMELHASDREFPALGLMHTSVGEDLWAHHVDEDDNPQPIEWDRTWSLYGDLAGSVRPADPQEPAKPRLNLPTRLNAPRLFPDPAPDHELAVQVLQHQQRSAEAAVKVLQHQLRNIEHCLGVMVEDWRTRAKTLDDGEVLQKLAARDDWAAVTRREAQAKGFRQLAGELQAYIDTWKQP